MKHFISISLLAFLLTACGEHRGHDIIEFTGEYRFYNGVAEFFDCKSSRKYYLSKSGIHKELENFYEKLNFKDHDVYIKITGYMKDEERMEGLDPQTVFVPVKLLDHDLKRGCTLGIQQGQ